MDDLKPYGKNEKEINTPCSLIKQCGSAGKIQKWNLVSCNVS